MNPTIIENDSKLLNTTEGMPVIEVSDLRLRYGVQQVLDGLSFRLDRCQVVGLLGRNGAGKTSLLEAILGMRENATGRIRIWGEDPVQLSDTSKARIGYVPQRANLFEWMTPNDLMRYFGSFYPKWNDGLVNRLLRDWDIAPGKRISELSGGQQQRLSIIRALAHEPELILLDEPVASLDPVSRRQFLQELVTQSIGHGASVIFSTHILTDLERVAWRVAFLSQGQIVLNEPLDELLEHARVFAGPADAVSALVQSCAGRVVAQHAQGDQARWTVLLPAGWVAATAEPLATGAVSASVVNLEDLFQEVA